MHFKNVRSTTGFIVCLLALLISPAVRAQVDSNNPATANPDISALLLSINAEVDAKNFDAALANVETLKNLLTKRRSSGGNPPPTRQHAKAGAFRPAFVMNAANLQGIELLKLLKVRGINPAILDRVPSEAELKGIDVLVVTNCKGVSTADEPKIATYLKHGGSVVLVGLAPLVLASPDISMPPAIQEGFLLPRVNLAKITSWFGGIMILRHASAGVFAKSNPGSFQLPATLAPDDEIYEPLKDEIMPVVLIQDMRIPSVQTPLQGHVSGAADIDFAGAIAYEHPAGGRVYWQFHPYGFNPKSQYKLLDAFIAGMYWAAKRTSPN